MAKKNKKNKNELMTSFIELVATIAYVVVLVKVFKLWGTELVVVLLLTDYIKKKIFKNNK